MSIARNPVALVLVLLLSACGAEGAGDGDPRISSSHSDAGTSAFTAEPASPRAAEQYTGERSTFHLHGTLSVRTEPDESAALVRVLSRGAQVQLGAKDANGWAPVIDAAGARIGYLYRASDDVRSYAPADGEAKQGARRASPSASAERQYHRGPRGGCYTYTASGNKRYVDRSYCD
ncbi:MAG: SH3 domain-containing protein [Gemmatimonadetes bacterium]|nr:SH3 domain-containing protein [Gemmatimonadota bacterium]